MIRPPWGVTSNLFKGCRPLRGLNTWWNSFPGFAERFPPGFMPLSAARTPELFRGYCS